MCFVFRKIRSQNGVTYINRERLQLKSSHLAVADSRYYGGEMMVPRMCAIERFWIYGSSIVWQYGFMNYYSICTQCSFNQVDKFKLISSNYYLFS